MRPSSSMLPNVPSTLLARSCHNTVDDQSELCVMLAESDDGDATMTAFKATPQAATEKIFWKIHSEGATPNQSQMVVKEYSTTHTVTQGTNYQVLETANSVSSLSNAVTTPFSMLDYTPKDLQDSDSLFVAVPSSLYERIAITDDTAYPPNEATSSKGGVSKSDHISSTHGISSYALHVHASLKSVDTNSSTSTPPQETESEISREDNTLGKKIAAPSSSTESIGMLVSSCDLQSSHKNKHRGPVPGKHRDSAHENKSDGQKLGVHAPCQHRESVDEKVISVQEFHENKQPLGREDDNVDLKQLPIFLGCSDIFVPEKIPEKSKSGCSEICMSNCCKGHGVAEPDKLKQTSSKSQSKISDTDLYKIKSNPSVPSVKNDKFNIKGGYCHYEILPRASTSENHASDLPSGVAEPFLERETVEKTHSVGKCITLSEVTVHPVLVSVGTQYTELSLPNIHQERSSGVVSVSTQYSRIDVGKQQNLMSVQQSTCMHQQQQQQPYQPYQKHLFQDHVLSQLECQSVQCCRYHQQEPQQQQQLYQPNQELLVQDRVLSQPECQSVQCCNYHQHEPQQHQPYQKQLVQDQVLSQPECQCVQCCRYHQQESQHEQQPHQLNQTQPASPPQSDCQSVQSCRYHQQGGQSEHEQPHQLNQKKPALPSQSDCESVQCCRYQTASEPHVVKRHSGVVEDILEETIVDRTHSIGRYIHALHQMDMDCVRSTPLSITVGTQYSLVELQKHPTESNQDLNKGHDIARVCSLNSVLRAYAKSVVSSLLENGIRSTFQVEDLIPEVEDVCHDSRHHLLHDDCYSAMQHSVAASLADNVLSWIVQSSLDYDEMHNSLSVSSSNYASGFTSENPSSEKSQSSNLIRDFQPRLDQTRRNAHMSLQGCHCQLERIIVSLLMSGRVFGLQSILRSSLSSELTKPLIDGELSISPQSLLAVGEKVVGAITATRSVQNVLARLTDPLSPNSQVLAEEIRKSTKYLSSWEMASVVMYILLVECAFNVLESSVDGAVRHVVESASFKASMDHLLTNLIRPSHVNIVGDIACTLSDQIIATMMEGDLNPKSNFTDDDEPQHVFGSLEILSNAIQAKTLDGQIDACAAHLKNVLNKLDLRISRDLHANVRQVLYELLKFGGASNHFVLYLMEPIQADLTELTTSSNANAVENVKGLLLNTLASRVMLHPCMPGFVGRVIQKFLPTRLPFNIDQFNYCTLSSQQLQPILSRILIDYYVDRAVTELVLVPVSEAVCNLKISDFHAFRERCTDAEYHQLLDTTSELLFAHVWSLMTAQPRLDASKLYHVTEELTRLLRETCRTFTQATSSRQQKPSTKSVLCQLLSKEFYPVFFNVIKEAALGNITENLLSDERTQPLPEIVSHKDLENTVKDVLRDTRVRSRVLSVAWEISSTCPVEGNVLELLEAILFECLLSTLLSKTVYDKVLARLPEHTEESSMRLSLKESLAVAIAEETLESLQDYAVPSYQPIGLSKSLREQSAIEIGLEHAIRNILVRPKDQRLLCESLANAFGKKFLKPVFGKKLGTELIDNNGDKIARVVIDGDVGATRGGGTLDKTEVRSLINAVIEEVLSSQEADHMVRQMVDAMKTMPLGGGADPEATKRNAAPDHKRDKVGQTAKKSQQVTVGLKEWIRLYIDHVLFKSAQKVELDRITTDSTSLPIFSSNTTIPFSDSRNISNTSSSVATDSTVVSVTNVETQTSRHLVNVFRDVSPSPERTGKRDFSGGVTSQCFEERPRSIERPKSPIDPKLGRQSIGDAQRGRAASKDATTVKRDKVESAYIQPARDWGVGKDAGRERFPSEDSTRSRDRSESRSDDSASGKKRAPSQDTSPPDRNRIISKSREPLTSGDGAMTSDDSRSSTDSANLRPSEGSRRDSLIVPTDRRASVDTGITHLHISPETSNDVTTEQKFVVPERPRGKSEVAGPPKSQDTAMHRLSAPSPSRQKKYRYHVEYSSLHGGPVAYQIPSDMTSEQIRAHIDREGGLTPLPSLIESKIAPQETFLPSRDTGITPPPLGVLTRQMSRDHGLVQLPFGRISAPSHNQDFAMASGHDLQEQEIVILNGEGVNSQLGSVQEFVYNMGYRVSDLITSTTGHDATSAWPWCVAGTVVGIAGLYYLTRNGNYPRLLSLEQSNVRSVVCVPSVRVENFVFPE